MNNENSYSRACEIRGKVEGTINEAVLHDIIIFKEFFDYDFTDMMEKLQVPAFSLVLSYEGNMQESKVYNTRIRDRICTLAVRFKENRTPAVSYTHLDVYKRQGGLHTVLFYK